MTSLAELSLPFVPERASSVAGQVDLLFYFLVLLTCAICGLIFGTMAFFLYKYRKGSKADRTPDTFRTWIPEAIWSGIPFVIAMGIATWGATLYAPLKTPPEVADALEINVIGKQWMWNVQHPEGHRELNELHVPVGRTVRLVMTSQDVIHDFGIPAFRLKQDVLPGRYTTQWFKATKPGRYHLFCDQLCGMGHAEMVGWITVMTPVEYNEWINVGAQEGTVVARGERLFRALGCSGCHGENAQIRAPSLVGVYGHPVPLETDHGIEIVTADDRYIHDSILLPQKQIVASYGPPSVMPSYAGQIGEEEVFQLVQYIKSLGRYTPDEYLRQNQGVGGQTQVHVPTTQNVPHGTPAPPTAVPAIGQTPPNAAPTPAFSPRPTSY